MTLCPGDQLHLSAAREVTVNCGKREHGSMVPPHPGHRIVGIPKFDA